MRILLLAVLPLAAGCATSSGSGTDEAGEGPEPIAITHFGDDLEWFLEYSPIVQGEVSRLHLHLTALADGRPIADGTLTVSVQDPSGRASSFEVSARKPGLFEPSVMFARAGPGELALSYRHGSVEETIHLAVAVHPDDASAARDSAALDEPDGAIVMLKEQQWTIGLRSAPVGRRRLVERLVVPGEVSPAAGARAVVTPPIAGRVLPPPGGSFPRVGQTVEVGQVLAVIEPPLTGPQAIQNLANQAQIRTLAAELAVRQMDVEVEIRRAEVELEHAHHVYDRYQTLSLTDAIARKRIDEARHDLEIAEAVYEGRLKMREPIEQARQALRTMLDPDAADHEPGACEDGTCPLPLHSPRLALRAPLSGTVTTAEATEGEFVDGTRALWTIINLDQVWIEARVSEFDLDRVLSAPAAEVTLPAYPDRRFAILGPEGDGTLIDVGSVVDPETRTVPVRYEVANRDGLWKVGLFAEVAIQTARVEEALAIPETALVDEDGRPTAYVQRDGEHFQRRDLELGLRDAGFVQVKRGLTAGERVVVHGAYAVRLASASAAIPDHGHDH